MVFPALVSHLPAAARSCCSTVVVQRAGVERVMGFCTEDDVEEFFGRCRIRAMPCAPESSLSSMVFHH